MANQVPTTIAMKSTRVRIYILKHSLVQMLVAQIIRATAGINIHAEQVSLPGFPTMGCPTKTLFAQSPQIQSGPSQEPCVSALNLSSTTLGRFGADQCHLHSSQLLQKLYGSSKGVQASDLKFMSLSKRTRPGFLLWFLPIKSWFLQVDHPQLLVRFFPPWTPIFNHPSLGGGQPSVAPLRSPGAAGWATAGTLRCC